MSRLRQVAPGRLLSRITSPGGGWDYLEAHGHTHGLEYVYGLPGGSLSAQVSLDAPPTANIPALVPGATFEVTRGVSTIWRGKVSEIAKGAPWSIKVVGMGGLATGETAMQTGTLDSIIDASIADGLPWTRPVSFGSTTKWKTDDDPITTKLDEVLTASLSPVGKQWVVDNRAALTAVTEPTGLPTLLVRVSDPSIPVGLNNYATRVIAHYYNEDDPAGVTSTVTETNTAAEAKFGRVKTEINLLSTDYPISTATAHAYALAYLNRVSPRLTLTGAFTVTTGQVTTATGGPVDIADVANISGKLARLQFATPLRDALVGSALAIDVVIGQATYNSDDATLELAPVGSGPTPVQAMFGANGGGDYVARSA